MGHNLRQGTIVIAAAVIMAYIGITSLTEVQDFAVWSGNLFWLSVASAVCGALMAVSSDRAAWQMVAASVLACLIFGGIWSYIVWALLSGGVIPYIEIALSDFVLLYAIQRGAILLMISLFFGLMAAVAVLTFVPEHYRR